MKDFSLAAYCLSLVFHYLVNLNCSHLLDNDSILANTNIILCRNWIVRINQNTDKPHWNAQYTFNLKLLLNDHSATDNPGADRYILFPDPMFVPAFILSQPSFKVK